MDPTPSPDPHRSAWEWTPWPWYTCPSRLTQKRGLITPQPRAMRRLGTPDRFADAIQ
eukprot:CAMPEP_0174379650 /NCGR_PEP_ID=MMETSP0811_2-20130205/122852_1 /TAXON_ID=73025 ORGANISM="Eutreptiella gymnastica-like, Strain CCMP1594" /NCGR_SAMPLE_ID=MMETSP0811_2 /ASSEMBLY_ACC=CAM_ASM_000667 /LENGTH=56 /DNA_ID=CAMNT_0015532259 /DNA_START=2061 /DNA_END=2231 /DNA_ORIENTATION=+